MRISELIDNLEKIKNDNGDGDVTCQSSLIIDVYNKNLSVCMDQYIGNLVLREDGKLGRRVRIYF